MKKRRSGSRRIAAVLGFTVVLALFGRAEAAAPAVPTITVTPTTLTPFSSGGCAASIHACYTVRGTTDPAVKVIVVVSDAFGKTVEASTYSAERTDPWSGFSAGDYALAPNVTGLGTHDTSSSQLSFVAYAEDLTGVRSGPSTAVAVTKIAHTAGDTNPPTLTVSGSIPGQTCGTGWCNFNSCAFNSVMGSGRGCTGEYRLTGSAEDNNATAYGAASEIASVLFTVKNSSGVVVYTEETLGLRRGTTGYWTSHLKVADYTPGQSYTWTLVATDAAGNPSAARTGSFTRVPL